MSDPLQNQLAQILAAMQDAAQQYGPQALDTAVRVKQVDSIALLLPPLVCLLALVALLRFVWAKTRPPVLTPEQLERRDELRLLGHSGRSTGEDRELKKLEGESLTSILDSPGSIFPCVGGIALFAFSIPLLNVWLWVGVFNPQLALAHDVLQKVMGQ